VLTNVKNIRTQEIQGVIQVQVSVRIRILHHMCVSCIIIIWIETPSTLSFIG
jgi:hypothetical protein